MAIGTTNERDTRGLILDAAAERFARFGPRKTSMEEIAREAGYSRATVYAHFGSKDDLYAALLERSTRGFVREATRCAEGAGDAREKLRAIVLIARRVYSASPVLLGAILGDEQMSIERVASATMRAHEREIIGLLSRVLAEGVASGSIRPVDPDAVAYLMYQLGRVLVVREASGQGDFPFRKILDTMDDLINYGLARPRARMP